MTAYKKAAPREKVEKNGVAVPAEFLLIGAMLKRQDLICAAVHLTPDHFFDLFCSKAYTCAVDLHMRGQSVDISSLHSELSKVIYMSDEDLFDELTSCEDKAAEIVTESVIKSYAKIVANKFIERQISAAAAPIDDISRNDGLTSEQKIEQARQILNDAEKKISGQTQLISADEMIEMTLAQSEETRLTGTIPGIPTGFAELDAMTSGFAPAELIILAARPSMGKTALALCIAHHASVVEKRPVLFISLEMNAKQIGPRWISLIAGVDMHPITNGHLTDHQIENIRQAWHNTQNAQFFIDETPAMTLSQICNRARAMHVATEGGLGMLVVDYLQLITDSGRAGANKADLVGEISRGLKQLSRELKIPVIALSQLNRDLEKRQDKRPQMSDLRDSGAIEQDADVILFLYRDEVYNKQSIDAGLAELIVAKQRKGKLGTVIVRFDGAKSRFYDHDAATSTTQLIKKFRETDYA